MYFLYLISVKMYSFLWHEDVLIVFMQSLLRDYEILIKTPKQNNAKDNPQKKARQQMKRF